MFWICETQNGEEPVGEITFPRVKLPYERGFTAKQLGTRF